MKKKLSRKSKRESGCRMKKKRLRKTQIIREKEGQESELKKRSTRKKKYKNQN